MVSQSVSHRRLVKAMRCLVRELRLTKRKQKTNKKNIKKREEEIKKKEIKNKRERTWSSLLDRISRVHVWNSLEPRRHPTRQPELDAFHVALVQDALLPFRVPSSSHYWILVTRSTFGIGPALYYGKRDIGGRLPLRYSSYHFSLCSTHPLS